MLANVESLHGNQIGLQVEEYAEGGLEIPGWASDVRIDIKSRASSLANLPPGQGGFLTEMWPMATKRAFPKNCAIRSSVAPDVLAQRLNNGSACVGSTNAPPAFSERRLGDSAITWCVEEAQDDALFNQLWACGKDIGFRSYACAALAFARVFNLSAGKRAELYREIATARRAQLLDRLSEMNGWKNKIRLLSKTTYQVFEEVDWRTLFLVSENADTRRVFGHMKEISPVLVHQVSLAPEPIRLPAVLAVLNKLHVSKAHWRQLNDALADTPPQLLPSVVAKAKNVKSTGAFWDFFFECVEKRWRPFDLPERFLISPMLEPLRTTKELEREGLRMKNCLANQAVNVRAGRKAYFRWQGAQPATVQFIRASCWRLGKILGPKNKSLPLVEVEPIRWWAESLLAAEHDDDEASSDEANATIRALCSRARRMFTVEERDRLAAALHDIRGKTQGLGPDTCAYCIFGADQGFIQFMADVDCHEYLCEIQSHHFSASIERKLTDEVVNLIAGSGFHWPRRRQNFSRWFRVRADADIDALIEFSLGILNEVFGHESGRDLALTVHLP